MTPEGWFCMILAVSAVTSLFVWCCWRVLCPQKPIQLPDPGKLAMDEKLRQRRRRRRLQKRTNVR
ncbi:MAG: hypothetical protein Q4D98_01525 [Planctomycetia bacterium]|nr:hypothetical protein [Planctomycetia bacterium]